jgi:RHS repeat-associated protein
VFGLLQFGGISQTNLNYTGQRRDESGLLYYHARYYDPVLGRFLSPDTQAPELGNPQDLNLYSYVHNNPVRYNDPTGHCIPYIGDCRPVWETGQGLNTHDFQEYSAGVVEGMGSLGASVASLAKADTWQSAARGLEVVVSDPGGAASTLADAAIDQGKAVMETVASVASDPAAAAAKLNDDPRALGRTLGQAAGNLALAKVMKDLHGGGESCAFNSFSWDTLVATANGAQPIGTLHPGDLVLAYDEATGSTNTYTITAVWVNIDPVLVDLTLDSETIETTPHHPFYTTERGWVDAGALSRDAHIRKANGTAGVAHATALLF